MILDLKETFDCEGYSREMSFDYDMSAYEDAAGCHPIEEPIKVRACVENRAGVVTIYVSTHFDYHTECDRCCMPLCEHFDFSFGNVLSKQASGEGENGDIVVVDGDTFDLDEFISSNIILNLPMKHLCKSDCKGLCHICGKNLNDGECKCDRSDKISPFSALKDFKE